MSCGTPYTVNRIFDFYVKAEDEFAASGNQNLLGAYVCEDDALGWASLDMDYHFADHSRAMPYPSLLQTKIASSAGIACARSYIFDS